MTSSDQFAPFERWVSDLARKGVKLPTGARELFRAGYMLALTDGHVVWRGDRAAPRTVAERRAAESP